MSVRLVLVPTAGVGAGLMVAEEVDEVGEGVGDMQEDMVGERGEDTNWQLTSAFFSCIVCSVESASHA